MIELLNQLLYDFVYAEETVEGDFTFIRSLQDVILKPKTVLMPQSYRMRMRRNHSQQLAHQFLKKLDKRYDEYFTFLLDTGKVTVHKRMGEKLESLSTMTLTPNGKIIDIYETETMEDAYTYCHEVMHSWNCNETGITLSWHLMTEAFSILTESLQQDDMASFQRSYPEYKKNKRDTYFALRLKAIRLGFELDLVQVYMQYGYIDDFLLTQLLYNYPLAYQDIVLDHLDWIWEHKTFDFDCLQRDVIGGVMASHMHQRILDNPRKLGEFIDLNDHCNEIAFLDILRYLDLEIEDEDLVILSASSRKILEKNYRKELKTL